MSQISRVRVVEIEVVLRAIWASLLFVCVRGGWDGDDVSVAPGDV